MILTSENLKQKASLILWYLAVFFTLIIGVLFYFQIYQSSQYVTRSSKNFTRYEKVHSLRGTIFDRNGTPLATNRPVISLVWRGTGKKTWSPEQQTALEFLARITATDYVHNEALALAERRQDSYILLKDLSFEILSKIAEQLAGFDNIALVTTFARHYPYTTNASHFLGYFRETVHDKKGTMGLELLLEEELCGVEGTDETIINATGRTIQKRELEKALTGKDIYTTLNFDLQSIAEDLFDEEQRGSIVIMDPTNGDILTLLSRPSFDPTLFSQPISAQTWEEIKNKQAFINRAFSTYPPASLFKLITTAAALEEGIITHESKWLCNGQFLFGGRTFLCNRHEHGGHGPVTIENALAQSCNIPFYDIGKRISINTLARYAHEFGLGQETGIILPEKKGFVPTSAWKQKVYGEPWWQGETLSIVIGQGALLATPIQLGCTVGGICTGKHVRPRVLLNEPVDIRPLAISSRTLNFLRQSMRMTIKEGTGRHLNRLKDIELYAKTGTAQTCSRALSKRELGKQYLEHAWFICYAQYKDFQPIVLVIFIENVGSALFATRMANKFFIKLIEYYNKIG